MSADPVAPVSPPGPPPPAQDAPEAAPAAASGRAAWLLHAAAWLLPVAFLVALLLPIAERPRRFPRLFLVPAGSGLPAHLRPVADLESAFEDLFIRRAMIDTYHRLLFAVFHTVPDSAVLGQHGWLFYCGEAVHDGHSLDDFAGTVSFGDDRRRQWQAVMRERQAWCDQQGIVYQPLIAPSKETIYAQFLPPAEQRRGVPRRRSDLVVEATRGVLHQPMLYPTDQLRHAIADQPLYLRTDTHWSEAGALLVCHLLIAQLPRGLPLAPLPERSDFAAHWFPYAGDIPRMCLLAGAFPDTAQRLIPLRTWPASWAGDPILVRGRATTLAPVFMAGSPDDVLRIVNPASPRAARAVLFCDSFGAVMLPFISQAFSELVAVRRPFDRELVAREHATVVLHEVTERYLDHLLEDR